ncbi:MAG: penicillin-binding protein [Streptosporangiales bacterium]|nr:penicillin-binding protein [Streptosporangiales bacterium]
MPRDTVRRLCAATLVGALLATLLVACGESDAERTARSFLSAWQRGEGQAAGRLTDAAPKEVAKRLDGAFDDLQAGRPRLRLGDVTEGDSGEATATFRATMRLQTLGVEWSYRGRLALREVDGRWRVVWAPTVIHPQLKQKWRLWLARQFPSRAPIYDAGGGRLMLNRSVVVVGVVPAAMKNEARTLRILEREIGIDAEQNAELIEKSPRENFVPLITLRSTDYEAAKKDIHDLPGVQFRTEHRPLAKTRGYARQLLGTVGPVTAERLKELGSPYTSADNVGSAGLQAEYERRLAGVPKGWVQVVDDRGVKRKTLATFAGRGGHAVRTSIDESVQDAAERALDTTSKPAALVAVRPSSGKVLAVANRPVDDSFNRALVGQYPPGSTFKAVTTAALLDNTSLRPQTTVPCPPTITEGGKQFRNFEGEAAGSPSFREDFAISCNTAFIRLARKLSGAELRDAARTFGFGAEYSLGVPSYSGQMPKPRDATEHAAASIGQGRVLASPLTMATVAAAARSGTWRPPVLVTKPDPGEQDKPRRLDPQDARTLRSLMRGVVTDGTANGLAGMSGVAGKTGTAEYGSEDPPRTHAWFIGYRGDLAFAVLVEDGGVGGRAAVPIAKTFLRHN